MRIVFVCTGNTCRSSMAEALAEKWREVYAPGRTDLKITSAGLAASPGSPASPQAVEVMGRAGIDLTKHRAKRFNQELAETGDLILTMTEEQKQSLSEKYPAAAAKVYTLAEFAAGRRTDITDPIGWPLPVYQKCASELQELVAGALHKILKQA